MCYNLRYAREKTTNATQWKIWSERREKKQLVERIENVDEKEKKLRASKHRIENLRVISFKSNFNLTCDTLDATQV